MSDTPNLYSGYGYWDGAAWSAEPKKEDPPPKCECGVTITMGKDDQPGYHSDYCPVYVEWKKKEKKDA